MGKKIDYADIGIAQHQNGTVDSLLIGVIEVSEAVFYISADENCAK